VEPLLISIYEAARLAGVGRDTAIRLVNTGVWPSEVIGKQRRVPRLWILNRYSGAVMATVPDAAISQAAEPVAIQGGGDA